MILLFASKMKWELPFDVDLYDFIDIYFMGISWKSLIDIFYYRCTIGSFAFSANNIYSIN